jgi:cytochrome c5
MNRIPKSIILCVGCLIAAALWVGCSSAAFQPTQAPPTTSAAGDSLAAGADGAALLQARCSVCHSVSRVTNAKQTRDQWDQTVTRMIERGAQLTDAEKSTLVDYLAANYGP